ncbi:glycosyltransferase family 2 protein [Histidinibacterium lentulum]|uniref:Glycosyltransferase family 2 protein n=1 Tax=Histidinibacterium lentulum TaxID=2480588 RepID=A0A3N2RA45_9RHOB|nr:glycosyltransferase family 2 protein [Histidinibacterium lentulum]ROU04334.1 glycosyltransferase family 2 protein [Histidinibacterium lentulum]
MDLSIVIVNWNTEGLLRDCLHTVLAGLGPLEAEVLVVDNASTDGSVPMLRAEFPGVRLFESARNLGFAAGNNVALREARGRHVMLLNTDTLVHGDVLPKAVAWLDAHPRVGVMGPKVLNTGGTVQPSCSAFPSLKFLSMQTLGLTRIARLDGYRMTGWDRSSERRVDVISGAAMIIRRAAMEEVGLLDEAFFFYGEETDWCHRFARAGWALVYVPIPAITHFGNGSAARLDHRRDVLMTEGTTRLHRKHGGLAAGLACYGILSLHNISRAGFWSALRLMGRKSAAARARHFRSVVADLRQAWPGVAGGTAR